MISTMKPILLVLLAPALTLALPPVGHTSLINTVQKRQALVRLNLL
jgi:hypothetical protein